MKRRFITRRQAITLVALAVLAAVVVWLVRPVGPRIPPLFAGSIPDGCGQVVLVLSPSAGSAQARMWLLERNGPKWKSRRGPVPVALGHNGLAWGRGEHQAPPPPGFREKYEGDRCSPAGVFRIPFAFGTAPADDAGWLRLPYTPLTPAIIGVDDPKSAHYNELVDSSVVARDWDSDEPMTRHDRLYEWGAFIAHNPGRIPGAGSCIFLHLWSGPNRGTAGCTAMSAEDLRAVLAWLDAAKDPRIVQGLEDW